MLLRRQKRLNDHYFLFTNCLASDLLLDFDISLTLTQRKMPVSFTLSVNFQLFSWSDVRFINITLAIMIISALKKELT